MTILTFQLIYIAEFSFADHLVYFEIWRTKCESYFFNSRHGPYRAIKSKLFE